MLKKFVRTAIVGAAVLGLVGTAAAYDRELNLYGASAQHTFWTAAVPAWLNADVADDGLDCATVSTTCDVFPKPVHCITIGTGCTFPNETGLKDIAVRYTSKNSSYGIGAACNMDKYSEGCSGQPGFVKMCDDAGLCGTAQRTCKNVHLGASDAEMTSFTQKTQPIGRDTANVTCQVLVFPADEFVNPPANCDEVLTYNTQSVVVPFGFIANNQVTKTRCTLPGPSGPNGEDKAYPHWGWQCVDLNDGGQCELVEGSFICTAGAPSKIGEPCGVGDPPAPDNSLCNDADGFSKDCVGYYKCLNDGTGTLRCGGTTATEEGTKLGQICSKVSDCADVIYNGEGAAPELTKCEAMPIDNLSRLQVLLIFSNENKAKLTNWNQFGPWYPNLTITRCMRCAGSGTHATFDLQVFRGDLTLTEGYSTNFYQNNGSTQMLTCVNSQAGGVGYIDADNPITQSAQNVHIVKYQGVEPTREKIRNCEYNYWNPQQLYGIVSELNDANNRLTDLVSPTGNQSLVKFAGNASTLELLGFPYTAFWGTQGEQKCQKSPTERDYPTLK